MPTIFTFTFENNVSKKQIKIQAYYESDAWIHLAEKVNPKGIPCIDVKKMWHIL